MTVSKMFIFSGSEPTLSLRAFLVVSIQLPALDRGSAAQLKLP
jgi:hypothetical protein